MIIIPAIDLYEKKAVRLYKGDYAQMTVYSEDPVSVAFDFKNSGAEFVHTVDLEGARDGTAPNLGVVAEIAEKTGLFVEIGGGIRSMETVDAYFSRGVSRVILGTAAINDRAFLEKAVEKYGAGIAVGADVKDGFIAVKGWLESSRVTLDEFLEDMQRLGIENVICTDISRDGAMRGANLELYKRLSEKYKMKITASGGVSSMKDIEELRSMDLYAAIIGKAYYTGAIDLGKAIEAAK